MISGTTVFVMAVIGFALGAIGAMGAELLERFIGRSLEAYCRLRGNRDRFGEVLDLHDDAAKASEYLRVIGTVAFLVGGTLAMVLDEHLRNLDAPVSHSRIAAWVVTASILMIFTYLWMPAAVTRFASAPLLYRTWPFWRLLSVAMTPFSIPPMIIAFFARRIAGHQDDEGEEEDLLEDEIRTIVAVGTREGHFGPGVREMIQGVMELRDDSVRHIMTPRSDVDAIELRTPWPEVLKIVRESGRTRLPVYRDTLDQIEGVLYVKDLLRELQDWANPDVPLADLLRKAWMVPGSRRVDELLQEFLHSRSHMAIVIDEFRHVSGVVTIEDALEEIVGEIVDESDEEEQVEFTVLDEWTVNLSGRVMVDEINDRLGWEIPESEDYETIAGYVLHTIGYIPVKDETFVVGPLDVKVLRASSRQIETMRIQHRENQASRLNLADMDRPESA